MTLRRRFLVQRIDQLALMQGPSPGTALGAEAASDDQAISLKASDATRNMLSDFMP